MEKKIASKMLDDNPNDLNIFKEWGKVNEKIIKFQNNSNLDTFKFLFGDEEGDRLWRHFRHNCDSKFDKLRTYLGIEQFNDLLVNIYYNDSMYYCI